MSFNGQVRESKRYASHLHTAEKAGVKRSWVLGAMTGLMFVVFMGAQGLGVYPAPCPCPSLSTPLLSSH